MGSSSQGTNYGIGTEKKETDNGKTARRATQTANDLSSSFGERSRFVTADRERLRAELDKQPRVYILKPDLSPEAVRRGQQMAAEIRQELEGKITGTLEETMIELRGRSWMS